MKIYIMYFVKVNRKLQVQRFRGSGFKGSVSGLRVQSLWIAGNFAATAYARKETMNIESGTQRVEFGTPAERIFNLEPRTFYTTFCS